MPNDEQIICAASAYSRKYYYNEASFGPVPKDVKKELQLICTLFIEEVGGEIIFYFDDEGVLMIKTDARQDDAYYDEISSGLLVRKIQMDRIELFSQLEQFFKVFVLKEI